VVPLSEKGYTRKEANLEEMDTGIWSLEEYHYIKLYYHYIKYHYIWNVNPWDSMSIVLKLEC
jgi:hypothetical protein